MQAIILAGGKGTRLRPYTATFPKPLVPLGDKPILEIVIHQLKKAGFGDIIISTGHLAGLIEAYFGNGENLGVKIRYVREETPLNTAGALGIMEGAGIRLDEDFLVINGDILTTLDYGKLMKFHKDRKATATIGVFERVQKIDYGVITADGDMKLKDYVEKPTMPFLVSMGVNALSRKALASIKKGEALGMPDLMLRLRKKGDTVCCFKDRCDWLDIGRPEDYELAQKEMEEHPEKYLRD